MDLFWACHNSVIHLVHLEEFYQDQEDTKAEYYSLFLHLTMLAVGVRYADKTRPDIQRLFIPGSDRSTLHEKAITMAKDKLEKPGGISSIQAFQLLGALEYHNGMESTGWLYTGSNLVALKLFQETWLIITRTILSLSV